VPVFLINNALRTSVDCRPAAKGSPQKKKLDIPSDEDQASGFEKGCCSQKHISYNRAVTDEKTSPFHTHYFLHLN
jgi:hypothetical protein